MTKEEIYRLLKSTETSRVERTVTVSYTHLTLPTT